MEETRPAARKYYGSRTGKKQACVFSECNSDGTFPTPTSSHWQEADLLHVDPAVPPAPAVPREVESLGSHVQLELLELHGLSTSARFGLLKEQTMAGLVSPRNVVSAPCTHMCCSLTRAQSMAPGCQR